MKKIYLFANWKMYLNDKESEKLASQLSKKKIPKNIEMIVFPSALSFDVVKKKLKSVGAQNTYWLEKGGYTGEVSAKMYKDAGCKYCLVGHSERRHQFSESDEDVNKKIDAILNADMTPVLCVGETAIQRKKGLTDEVVSMQIKKAYKGIQWNKKKVLIAYEPVWAISANKSGKFCSVFEAEKEHSKIRKLVKKILKIEPIVLFGGSVNADIVQGYMSSSQIDGVLVGGASVKLKSWSDIINKVQEI